MLYLQVPVVVSGHLNVRSVSIQPLAGVFYGVGIHGKAQFKGEKQLVFKFHKRKRYRRLKGHRQQLTKLKIVKVQATSRAKKAVKAEAEAVAEAPVAE